MKRTLSFERQLVVTMTDDEFSRLRSLVYMRTHIYCPDTQKPLFERKIRLRLRALQSASFQDYYTYLTESHGKEQELSRLLDMMAIHETSFFRVSGHFHGLETRIFPELLDMASQPAIQAWSAGCSTGEEPYSLAMTFLDERLIFIQIVGAGMIILSGVVIYLSDIAYA
jgi:chemotaxis protein methyltransferase CheR